jgi:hypothetical protein
VLRPPEEKGRREAAWQDLGLPPSASGRVWPHSPLPDANEAWLPRNLVLVVPVEEEGQWETEMLDRGSPAVRLRLNPDRRWASPTDSQGPRVCLCSTFFWDGNPARGP